MKKMSFKAYAITNEIDLNKIAEKCGIPKKYTWEEPLILDGDILKGILEVSITNDQKILVFSFGSVVFINIKAQEIQPFVKYLKTIRADIALKGYDKYYDDYELQIGDGTEIQLTDEYAIVPYDENYLLELVSVVIAKSVALEKTEDMLGNIFNHLEPMIDRLEKGKLRISHKELANTAARVLRHEYNTISYIMILDKPDITWINSSAEEFYNQMSEFFELNDRYEIVKSKTEILNNIVNGFSTISSSIRGLFVEWIIVLLIVVEVILMTAELLK